MDTVQPGQTLGPYRIIAQIGQGGMATVYKAYHAAMDRYVAVKVLPRQLAESPEFMGRFQQEARTIANLEHAHILPVHDYGEGDGFTYLVMRYLDAGTLKDRIQSGALTLPEVDRFFSQLADALDYAHAHNVIHRDLKPSNVLVDARGNLFLTDFGVAKLLESSSQFTTTGGLIGTPAYMSPEQAQGQKVDRRSDIYSLGIILYEMVTGRVPFAADTPLAVVLKHLNEPLPLPSTIKPDISPTVERVILKALAKNPDDRFASVSEFLAAWKNALASGDTLSAPAPALTSPVPSAPPPPPPPLPSAGPGPTRRRMPIGLIVGGAAVLGMLVLALLGGAAIVMLPLSGAPQPTANASATAPSSDLETTESTQPITAGEPGWTSWAAGNTIYTLAVNASEDQVLAGGPGSLTVWDIEDESVQRRFTSGNGLPDPTVTALFVDTDETWWIGTNYGVAHFDGENWLAYYDTGDGLDSGNITSITRSGENLVVGTAYGPNGGGVNLFDGQRWKLAPDFPSAYEGENPEALSNNVNVVLAGDSDELWVGTNNGLGHFDGQAWTRFSMDDGLPSNRVVTLMFDQNDELWAGTDAGAAHLLDQTFEPEPNGPPYGVYGMLQDRDGHYWFSGGGGIWQFDPAEANWTEHSQQTGELPVYTTFGAAQDADGNLYFASDGGGLLRWNGDEFTPWVVPNVPTQAAFGRILSAPDGQLWFIQEDGSNVDRFDPSQETWSPITDGPCSCQALAFDSSGNVWASEYNGGFWIINENDTTHVTVAQGLPEDVQVLRIAFAPDGTPWIGTDHGVAFFDGQKITEMLTAENTGFASDFVRSLFAASDGSMWVGLQGGLSRRTPDGDWEHFTIGNPFSDNFSDVYDIAEDPSGAIWVATYGDGVYRFADGEWQNFAPDDPGVQLPSTQVNSVTTAPDGSLWFGTYYSGAARFDGKEWTSFDVEDGLIDYNVNDIFVDASGAVWFATSGGVTRYIP